MKDSLTKYTLQGVAFLLSLFMLMACTRSELQAPDSPVPISGTGTLEGREVAVASELGGRIIALQAHEGDTVTEDAFLVRLDDSQANVQVAQATAAVNAASAQLASLQSGPREEEITVAQAAVALAQAQAQQSEKALLYAHEVISNPVELDLEMARARMELELAEQEIENAEAKLDAEKLNYHIYVDLKDNVAESTRRSWDLRIQAAEATITRAEAERDAAQAELNALYDLRKYPLENIAKLHAAAAAYTATLAGVEVAQASLDQIYEATHPQEIAIAEAQVAQARAALTMALTQRSMLTLTAPISGVVATRSFYTGEIVPAGVPILTLATLDPIYLTLYVPETRIGEVQVGQTVQVEVDIYPSDMFTGTVEKIALEAEYTPRSVETSGDRARRVFAVRTLLPNPDHRLRPGLPAIGTLIE